MATVCTTTSVDQRTGPAERRDNARVQLPSVRSYPIATNLSKNYQKQKTTGGPANGSPLFRRESPSKNKSYFEILSPFVDIGQNLAPASSLCDRISSQWKQKSNRPCLVAQLRHGLSRLNPTDDVACCCKLQSLSSRA